MEVVIAIAIVQLLVTILMLAYSVYRDRSK